MIRPMMRGLVPLRTVRPRHLTSQMNVQESMALRVDRQAKHMHILCALQLIEQAFAHSHSLCGLEKT